MTTIEISLLLLGAVVFIAGFIVPEHKALASEEDQHLGEELVKEVVEKEMRDLPLRLDAMTEETVTYHTQKAERALERISNEKLMAVGEYSDTVLEQINKNHKEAMFLYDMLSDKDKELKEALQNVTAGIQGLQKAVHLESIQMAGPDSESSQSAPESLDGFRETTNRADADVRNHNDIIIGLHEEGRSEVEIARALGLGIGEVRLVIDLYVV